MCFPEPGPFGSVFLIWQENPVTLLREHEVTPEIKHEEIQLIYSGIDVAYWVWLKTEVMASTQSL